MINNSKQVSVILFIRCPALLSTTYCVSRVCVSQCHFLVCVCVTK